MSRNCLQKIFFIWYSILILMVFGIVLFGGYTRLSGAGLSITEWKPISGILPPLTEKQWSHAFYQYQETPEYKHVNATLSLNAFKTIYWIEFIHRLLARLIGLLLLIPGMFFLVKGYFSPQQKKHFFVLCAFLGLQGTVGWYMVASGLRDNPYVSPYMLVCHLLMALSFISLLLWNAVQFGFLSLPKYTNKHVQKYGYLVLFLLLLTITYGGLVAGMKAGLIYNTFPLMGGDLLPLESLGLSPLYRNFFENPVMVQFLHRWFAILSSMAVVCYGWLWHKRIKIQSATKGLLVSLFFLIFFQVLLGIITLITQLHMLPAIIHQGAAFLLFLNLLLLHFQVSLKK